MGRGATIVSLPDSIRDAFVPLSFGLNCKIDPFISHTVTSESLQIGNTCCFKILLIQFKVISHSLYVRVGRMPPRDIEQRRSEHIPRRRAGLPAWKVLPTI